jgi:hypothetical protein
VDKIFNERAAGSEGKLGVIKIGDVHASDGGENIPTERDLGTAAREEAPAWRPELCAYGLAFRG